MAWFCWENGETRRRQKAKDKIGVRVERAFHSLKTMDLKVRPIRHRLEDRVRAHIFLCMPAYYVQWHLQEAWRPLTFGDEDQQAKVARDPVAPAPRSDMALRTANQRLLEDRTAVHSIHKLLADLSAIVRNEFRRRDSSADEPAFPLTTTPTATQRRALELVAEIVP